MLPLLLLAAEAVTPKPPTIDPTMAAEFWRAQAQLLSIKPAYEKADGDVKAAMARLATACGKDHIPADENGLKCVPKPDTVKEVLKK